MRCLSHMPISLMDSCLSLTYCVHAKYKPIYYQLRQREDEVQLLYSCLLNQQAVLDQFNSTIRRISSDKARIASVLNDF